MGKLIGIATHFNPDPDGIGCIWLLDRFGKGEFEDPDNFELRYWPAGVPPEGLTAEQWEDERGILAVDTGLGVCDNHSPKARELGLSSMDLVAQRLGIFTDPALQRILRIIRAQDLDGISDGSEDARLMGLFTMIRGWRITRNQPDRDVRRYSQDEVIGHACDCLDAIYAYERDQAQAFKDLGNARWRTVEVERGGKRTSLTVMSIVSGAYSASRVCRFGDPDREIPRADVVIVFQPDKEGSQIFGKNSHSPRKRVTLELAATYLRTRECLRRERDLPGDLPEDRPWRALRATDVPGIPEWHFAFSQVHVLNRSLSNPAMPLSILKRGEIFNLVCDAVGGQLPTGCPCRNEERPFCGKSACSFYLLHLPLCKFFRKREYEAQELAAATLARPVLTVVEGTKSVVAPETPERSAGDSSS